MQKRNDIVDIIRGFAMLLVVLGHTITGSTLEYHDSLLFQVIWTLQMPLFIIISGYVTRYSRPLADGVGLLKFIRKRSLAYLLPWVVWTLIIRAGIFGQTQYYNAEYLLWHTDSGYWFLLSIWTIAMVFGIADLLSNRIAKEKKIYNIFLHFAFCGIGMIILGVIAYILGLSFLGIKLTLYYLPMYLFGYLYGMLQEGLLSKKNGRTAVNLSIAICLCIWLALIKRIDFYNGADNGLFVVGRFVTSIMGCMGVIGLFTSVCAINEPTFKRPLSNITNPLQPLKWVGIHSLEVYLIHGFSLCLLQMPEAPTMGSLESWCLIFVNFIIAVVLSCAYIRIIESNGLMNKILFWK